KGLRGRTYETLFGLLTVTGLRSSEVVALNDGDLDHRQTTLLVRRTKFGKSRLVPVHPSTMEALAAYQAIRDCVVRQRLDEALFVSERGVRITQGAAEYTFARVGRHWRATAVSCPSTRTRLSPLTRSAASLRDPHAPGRLSW